MRLLMLMADGLEECEALMTRDILIRGGVEVVMASINNKPYVIGQYKLTINVNQVGVDNYKDFDGMILPGGGLGTKNLDEYIRMDELLSYYFKNNKLVAAICAAPSVISNHGYLDGYNFVSYADMNLKGSFKEGECVMRDRNVITGKNVLHSAEFAFMMIEYGKEKGLLDTNPYDLKDRIEDHRVVIYNPYK